MARPKKVQKVKEPVRVRQRKLANGNMSLYLDVYVKGVRKVESLGLSLIHIFSIVEFTDSRTPFSNRISATEPI